MNREIKYIRQRLVWFKELEKEIYCYTRQIEDKLKILERRLKKLERN